MYSFIWLHRVLVAALGLFRYSTDSLVVVCGLLDALRHVES